MFKVGPLAVDYSDYTINVTKSGKNFITDGRLIPTQEASAYVLNGYDISGDILIAMLHHGTDVFETVVDEYDRTKIYQGVSCEVELEISFGGNTYTKTITYSPPVTYPETSSCFKDDATSTITKNLDDTINITFDTGFTSDDPNIFYKIFLQDGSNLDGSTLMLAESDYLDTSQYTFSNIENRPYKVYVKIYYYKDGQYLCDNDNALDSLGDFNSALDEGFISWNSSDSKYYSYYRIREDMVDNVNGKAVLNLSGVEYEISLADGSYEAGSYPVSVTSSDGFIVIKVTNASTRSELLGSITLEETIDGGNTYDTKTYTISS